MRRSHFFCLCVFISTLFLISCKQLPSTFNTTKEKFSEDEEEGYDNPRARDSLEFEKTKDPSLGYVPSERLWQAITQTENSKLRAKRNRMASLTWTERGPNTDTIGTSNRNIRNPTNSAHTSGYIIAVLVDTLNDPSGNTVFCGGTTGGLWKTSNFLSPLPTWQKLDDHAETLSISSMCQDPSNASIMYYCTGEPNYGTATTYGAGIWKSVDAGTTWNKLSSTSSFIKSFKILCDASGNVYLAARPTTISVAQPFGLFRSTDHGASWNNITPANLTSDSTCTDIEISSTGRLHACFGLHKTRVGHWHTDDPVHVTPSTGWNASLGIRTGTNVPAAHRLEIACQGDILYGVTVNASDNADSCYKSIDGGATWTNQNTSVYPTGVLNNQGWYNITLAINPSNSHEFLIGGLDLYKSSDDGISANTRMSYWISFNNTQVPYVHADHHFMQWRKIGVEDRILIAGDGGIFLSRDGGATFDDKNQGLSIKQFYSCSIHPDAGSPYLLAGAQDNGSHSLVNPTLGGSTEVMGGDGCYTHISQLDPSVQFITVPFNQYYRTRNGGASWTRIFLSNYGLFVNPYEYDDGQNILYCSYYNNTFLRMPHADSSDGGNTDVLPVNALNGQASAFLVSPYTSNRLYLGSSSGKLFVLNNANTVTAATIGANLTDISPGNGAFLNCINVGSSDQYLVAVYSNFGVNNLWYSSDGGSSWSQIDGNLPDMPVRWAVFDPQHDDQLFIATATGVFHTDAVNGSSTQWAPETNLPTVRTDMLKIRASDNTLVVATYGRGLFTTKIPASPTLQFPSSSRTVTETSEQANGCKNYKDYQLNLSMVAPPTGDAVVQYNIRAGNTASEGKDFDYTTNGNFSAPSHQQLFASGVSGSHAITIRIYDDVEVETDESFTIDFTISGTTNAGQGNIHSFTFVIKSNEIQPVTLVSNNYLIGNAAFTIGSATQGNIFDARAQRKRAQIVYKASDLTASGMGAGKINSISFSLRKNSVRSYKNLTIGMGTTSLPYLADNGIQQVFTDLASFRSSYTTVDGLNTIPFDIPFDWDGVSNVVVEICYNNNTFDNSDFADPVICSEDDAASSSQSAVIYQTNIDCSSDFTNVFIFGSGIKPQIQFGHTNNGSVVSTALNASRTESLGPNSEVYFYSATGVLMARIKNSSSFDYGCTQVVIDRAGTSTSPFWRNNTANDLMNKTFHVIPTNNNPSGQYDISLYFSQAEVNGWQMATGASINSIQLVKAQGQIKDVSPSSPAAAGHVDVVNPTVTNFGSDYVLTYSFTNGFSSFGAGIPGLSPLPVGLLTFNGRLDKNASLLNWTTSWETSSRNFDLEKSADGIHFYRIANIPAAGNSNSERKYSFRDRQLNQMNYYRLRMNDIDSRSSLSQVVLVRYDQVSQNIWVVNNPFLTDLDIRFSLNASSAKMQLVSASGSVVQEKSWSHPANPLHWALPGNLSKGNYILRAEVDGEPIFIKLVKQ